MASEGITKIWFADGRLYAMTTRGNTLSQRLEIFPALLEASDTQREDYYFYENSTCIRWESIDEDICLDDMYQNLPVNYNNEVNSLLTRFSYLDYKTIAKYAGMHWTKLARYRYGVWTPSVIELKSITRALNAIGKELLAAV